jgi:predicted DNA-binding protein with PD1-like motif
MEKGTASTQTRPSRQVVGRVFRGNRLQEAFGALVEEHELRSAWVSAIGAFEWIELTEYNQGAQHYEEAHRFERCELLSMQGNLSKRDGQPFWHLHATISLREDGRDVTYGGHVVDGSVFALEFRIDCFDELMLRRANDEATGLQLWAGIEDASAEIDAPRVPEPASADRPKSATWAMAAELSTRAESVAPVEHRPERGDWIEHAKFGLCKIEGLTGDGVCIIKLPDARRKKIKLDALLVFAPREDDGRRIFPVRGRAKKG